MNELPLRIILEKPTAGVDFGIQQGGGAAYQTILKQRSKQQDLLFEFTVTLKQSESTAPDFSGKCVHGPRGERLSILISVLVPGRPILPGQGG